MLLSPKHPVCGSNPLFQDEAGAIFKMTLSELSISHGSLNLPVVRQACRLGGLSGDRGSSISSVLGAPLEL